MDRIEDVLEATDLNVDVDRSGNVMTIAFDNGEEVVINRHGPTQQMWLASATGAFTLPLRTASGAARAPEPTSGMR